MKQTNYYFLSLILAFIALRSSSLAFGSPDHMSEYQLLEKIGIAWAYTPMIFMTFALACAMLFLWVKPVKPYSYKVLLFGLSWLVVRGLFFGFLGLVNLEFTKASYEASQIARGVTPNPEMLNLMFSLPGMIITGLIVLVWYYFLFTIIKKNRSLLE